MLTWWTGCTFNLFYIQLTKQYWSLDIICGEMCKLTWTGLQCNRNLFFSIMKTNNEHHKSFSVTVSRIGWTFCSFVLALLTKHESCECFWSCNAINILVTEQGVVCTPVRKDNHYNSKVGTGGSGRVSRVVQLRVCKFFNSSGFSTELLCPPAATMSAWTAASQEKVSRAAGT